MTDQIKMPLKVILASNSPRRKGLLGEIIQDFTVKPADIDETVHQGESPLSHTLRLARLKAMEAAKTAENALIIGADTVVVVDAPDDQDNQNTMILGKPENNKDAKKMLRLLSARTHTVITGFCLLDSDTKKSVCRAVETRVIFKQLTDKEIIDYIATGEPMDKAGAYAIQGGGGKFVINIEGSYTNVVGLPLEELKEELSQAIKDSC